MRVAARRRPGGGAPAGRSRTRPCAWWPAAARCGSCRPGRAGWSPRPASTPPTWPRTPLVLLPEDGDASARRLRSRLRELLGVDVAVVVSDTFGRTWREGLTDVAVGAAGIAGPDRPPRRSVDAFGNRLETTQDGGGRRAGLGRRPGEGQARRRPGRRGPGPAPRTGAAPDPGTRPLVRLGAGDLFPYGSRDLVGSRDAGAELVPARRRAGGGRRGLPDRQRRPAGVPGGAALRRRGGRRRRRPPHRRGHHDDGGQPGRAARRGDRAAARRGLGDPLGAGRHRRAAPHSSAGCGWAHRRPDRRPFDSVAAWRSESSPSRTATCWTSCRTATPAAGSPSGTGPTCSPRPPGSA